MITTFALVIGVVLLGICIDEVTRWIESRNHETTLNPLPAPDATDAEFELWAATAIRLANEKPVPLADSRTAQRIRAQIDANHDAEVARFRAELDGWGESA